MTFGEKLRTARKQKKLTQKELALKIGAAHNSISNWENNQNKPDPDTIQELCWVLDVTPNYFFSSEKANWENLPHFDNIRPIQTKKIPLLGRIACGKPTFAEEQFETFIDASADMQADFCLQAKGDSMLNARIHDGDIVFVRQQPEVENGQIAAVIINDEATLKRVSYFPEKSMLILKPENPAYEDLVYINEELEDVHILGKAVAFQSIVK